MGLLQLPSFRKLCRSSHARVPFDAREWVPWLRRAGIWVSCFVLLHRPGRQGGRGWRASCGRWTRTS